MVTAADFVGGIDLKTQLVCRCEKWYNYKDSRQAGSTKLRCTT